MEIALVELGGQLRKWREVGEGESGGVMEMREAERKVRREA
jgi:hypothetical protein